jgi:hypothetical protein
MGILSLIRPRRPDSGSLSTRHTLIIFLSQPLNNLCSFNIIKLLQNQSNKNQPLSRGKESPVLIKCTWVLSSSDLDVRHNGEDENSKYPLPEIVHEVPITLVTESSRLPSLYKSKASKATEYPMTSTSFQLHLSKIREAYRLCNVPLLCFGLVPIDANALPLSQYWSKSTSLCTADIENSLKYASERSEKPYHLANTDCFISLHVHLTFFGFSPLIYIYTVEL